MCFLGGRTLLSCGRQAGHEEKAKVNAVRLLCKLPTSAWVSTTVLQSCQPAQSMVAFAFGLDISASRL